MKRKSRSTVHKKKPGHAARAGQSSLVSALAVSYIPATQAKNQFASVLEDVMQGRDVVITKHNSPKAVVMSVERFNALAKASSPDLSALSADFDARLARMQTPAVRTALQAAFDASPDELGRAALHPVRSR